MMHSTFGNWLIRNRPLSIPITNTDVAKAIGQFGTRCKDRRTYNSRSGITGFGIYNMSIADAVKAHIFFVISRGNNRTICNRNKTKSLFLFNGLVMATVHSFPSGAVPHVFISPEPLMMLLTPFLIKSFLPYRQHSLFLFLPKPIFIPFSSRIRMVSHRVRYFDTYFSRILMVRGSQASFSYWRQISIYDP